LATCSCLKQPELPLHNNASELAAREQAKAKNVSLHTKSEAGTKIKDSLMTISQTAKKLGVSTYKYILDQCSPIWFDHETNRATRMLMTHINDFLVLIAP
jgi:hypothetical protein